MPALSGSAPAVLRGVAIEGALTGRQVVHLPVARSAGGLDGPPWPAGPFAARRGAARGRCWRKSERADKGSAARSAEEADCAEGDGDGADVGRSSRVGGAAR
eukprot:scaffold3307_cov371-Prasinococcus_capsulatus_cf.AAC.1